MNILRYPERNQWDDITARPVLDVSQLNATVAEVLAAVKAGGDKAVLSYEEKFDHVCLDSLAVSEEEFAEAENKIPSELADAIRLAHSNIATFHKAQKTRHEKIETAPGVVCWQKDVAIERVGLYIPGGTAPLFSTVLMLATPAKIAGCSEIVLCTPPGRDGKINPAILVAAKVAGVSKIFKAGGVQAVGAMAYGTESVPKVYKIFGPGNQYVMAAKQQVSLHDVAIDMPAGPSEVCVIADANSNPEFVAADLLSQAEHEFLAVLARFANPLLGILSGMVFTAVVQSSAAAVGMALSNAYAPEHLILATDNYDELAEMVINAGSVFLGHYACESAGDYASGTNHTLPTHGYALAYNGVNLDSYYRKITFQTLSEQGIRSIGRAVEIMAEHEMLDAHKNAMTVRLNSLKQQDK